MKYKFEARAVKYNLGPGPGARGLGPGPGARKHRYPVFANLMKNYFKPLCCRDKHSIIKIDDLLRKHKTAAPLLKSLRFLMPMTYPTVQGKETLIAYK